MNEKPRMLITRRWPEAAEEKAREWFAPSLNEDDHRMSKEALQEALCHFDVICPTVSDHPIDEAMLGTEDRRCRILCNFGVGFNNIDTNAARRAGVVVTNTPGVLTDCTADIAMTLLLMVARRCGEGERLLRAGQWEGWCPTDMLATQVTGKKLGFVGFGRIAQAVAQRSHFGFAMQIQFYDPKPPPRAIIDHYRAKQCDSLKDVLKDADFVTVHCPGGGDNVHLIDAEALACMQANAFLINTSRGDVLDEAALVQALQGGQIAGAGLDVYEKEPVVSKALLSRDNVVLFPHLGSASIETRLAMGFCALENARTFFSGQEPPHRVA